MQHIAKSLHHNHGLVRKNMNPRGNSLYILVRLRFTDNCYFVALTKVNPSHLSIAACAPFPECRIRVRPRHTQICSPTIRSGSATVVLLAWTCVRQGSRWKRCRRDESSEQDCCDDGELHGDETITGPVLRGYKKSTMVGRIE